MRQIAADLYASRVEQIYGPKGTDALRRLLRAVHAVHEHAAYELLPHGFTVVEPLEESSEPVVSGSANVQGRNLPNSMQGRHVTVQAAGERRFYLADGEPGDMAVLAAGTLVYRYRDGDYIFVEGSFNEMPNPTGFPSQFGVPTFVDLDDALEYYASALARQSTCHILRQCWWDPDGRLVLSNKPEIHMRRSLAQHLRSTLRGHELIELREEQNVDESHPVDIKVTWSLSSRIALIEVKWMGDSVNEEGDSIATRYRDQRARDGAQQLANYLDANVQNAPQHVSRGYLVVYDARRRGVRLQGGNATSDDPRYYANREVAYGPEYHLDRDSFAAPVRFFLEPASVGA